MDAKARKELKEAQKIIKDGGFNLVCSNPEATLAVMRVFNAMKKDGYQLLRTVKLLDGMNELAVKATHEKCEVEAAAYLKAVYDIIEIIDDCL